ncbi:ead/Ea22-like family protein [Klebsiella variicola]|uniref:ead/Ea22-like family protein n=1 Tax=Klebsiella variicola TaxID=244366 RepID=UPI001CC963A2|nr:ead/Ea22-like family protein [Klebsiella variicola]MBZ7296921.1 ead/Ea22-like family protein [Klebsiella variicola]
MTDITELAQLRGRTVDYPYYLVECDCGKIYPSSELSGGEPMGDSGDYSDCYCPHCGEGEEHFEECADPETAWKAQQDKIDALVEALEKAQRYAKERDAENQDLMLTVGRLRVEREELESRTVTVKLTDINEYLAEVHDKTLNRAFRLLAEGVRAGDVAAMRAAGIKVEAE